MQPMMLLLFSQSTQEVIETDDGLGTADWVNTVSIELSAGVLTVQGELAESCVECDTEWRLGLRNVGSGANVPEVMFSATIEHLWIDQNMNWLYPTHPSDPILLVDQPWFNVIDNVVTFSIPLQALPVDYWSSVEIGLQTLSPQGNDQFGEGWSDTLILDEDGDGLNASEELTLGLDPEDADMDDDGLVDGPEIWFGTDPQNCDSDGDSLPDGLELGVTTPHPHTDMNVCFIADRQPSTTTDPLNSDSDEGGTNDGIEDTNQDGRVNTWETNPNDTTDDADNDGDDIPDALEDRCAVGFSEDADGDGISDLEESWLDTDADGTPNFCDEDDDNDGLPTLIEGTDDTDEDGLINAHDTDSDNDGILDEDESVHDIDCDDIPSWLDDNPDDGPCADSDLDGLTNEEEINCGTNPNDPDTDRDGILDGEDCPNVDPTDWTSPTPEQNEKLFSSGCAGSMLVPLLLLYVRRREHRR